METYRELKEKYPDTLILMRSGNWYVAHEDDAMAVSQICGITLTGQVGDKSSWQASFPNHALDTYLPKLVRAGKRVSICEDLSRAKTNDTNHD